MFSGWEGAMKDLRILVVDDNQKFCIGVERLLHIRGYTQVWTAIDGWQALDIVAKEHPDLVLLDLYLPGMDGMHVLSAIHKIDKNIQILMVTSEADEECLQAAVQLGAADYLVKPLEFSTLVTSIETHMNGTSHPEAA
jgi:DNA-binding response OmpR family regulator